jgi:hypothetical protein
MWSSLVEPGCGIIGKGAIRTLEVAAPDDGNEESVRLDLLDFVCIGSFLVN